MRLISMDTVGSTSDEARRLAEASAPHGTAVLARQQSAGRGRQGRVWISPPGNLHLSVVLRTGVAVQAMPQIGFIAALAVADAVDALLGRAATTLKWPNDVMIDGAKLAGLLVESQGDGVAILGIGMNLAHAPADLPYAVTALARHGSAAAAGEVAAAVLGCLDERLAQWRGSGFDAVRAEWRRRGPALGTAVTARVGAAQVAGRFAGLDGDGAMLLDTPDGLRRVVAGEVL